MKPSIPKGTRDFGPTEVLKRRYIIDTIRKVYEEYGYQPLETPAMENLNTLMGKYGDEGDKLLFRVLNQGQKVKKADLTALEEGNLAKFSNSLAERGLRYDLTIPFARYVVMNQHQLTFPFKRYQIQPVWRGDRPQKGRYREFFQCDADVVGSNSLLNEAELVQVFNKVYSQLDISVTVRLNNRKVLAGIADVIGCEEKMMDITIAIDKLDKIGLEGVQKELSNRGLGDDEIKEVSNFLAIEGDIPTKLSQLENLLATSETGMKGVAELKTLFHYISQVAIQVDVELDVTLARGLNYYTGTIFEVVANDVKMGSISGGGRYDDLTGTFGLPGVSGVGISFGLDRVYDVMEELGKFETISINTTQAMFINFGGETEAFAFKCLQELRKAGVPAEIYPDNAKMKKQMKYANTKQIPFVIFTGSEEMETGMLGIKNMETGEQEKVAVNELVNYLA